MAMKLKGLQFSNKYAVGSIANRNRQIKDIRGQVYREIIKAYNDELKAKNVILTSGIEEFLPIRLLEKIVKTVLPESLHFSIQKKIGNVIGDNHAALQVHYKEEDYSLLRYRIFIPASDNKMNIDELPTLMHEITHLLDYAINPKRFKLEEKAMKRGLFEQFYKIYTDLYYSSHNKEFPLFILKAKMKNILKDLSTDDKLLLLKNTKLALNGEILAYKANEFYTGNLRCNRFRDLYFNSDVIEDYRFHEKVKLIDKIRYEIISKERKKLAKLYR